jgi:hypothetical protein
MSDDQNTTLNGTLASDPIVQEVIGALGALVISVAPMGSRVTCNPPPVDTDEDWLVLLDSDEVQKRLEAGDGMAAFVTLCDFGFNQDGNPESYTGMGEGEFRSWRRGDVNIVTTPDPVFYQKFLDATATAKELNLLDKGDRIALFQDVLYGVRPGDQAQAPELHPFPEERLLA